MFSDEQPSTVTRIAGTTTRDGAPVGDGDIPIGDMVPGQSTTIRFQARVAGAGSFPSGTSTHINTAFARSTNALNVSDQAFVQVSTPGTPVVGNPSLTMQLTKEGRNITQGELAATTPVQAGARDTIEFTLRVRAGAQPLTNVLIQDALPVEMSFIFGSVGIDGQSRPDANIETGISLGNMQAQQERIIRFSALMRDPASLGTLGRTIINRAQARADSIPLIVAELPIFLPGVISLVAQVQTGPAETLFLALALGSFAGAAYAAYVHTNRFRTREAQGLVKEQTRENFKQ